MTMSKEKNTPAQGDKSDSELVKDHRALMNQDSAKPEDYPQEEREAQSLVDKSKRRDQSD